MATTKAVTKETAADRWKKKNNYPTDEMGRMLWRMGKIIAEEERRQQQWNVKDAAVLAAMTKRDRDRELNRREAWVKKFANGVRESKEEWSKMSPEERYLESERIWNWVKEKTGKGGSCK